MVAHSKTFSFSLFPHPTERERARARKRLRLAAIQYQLDTNETSEFLTLNLKSDESLFLYVFPSFMQDEKKIEKLVSGFCLESA